MSTSPELTDSQFVAALAAEALLSEARQSTGHRRLYLSGLFGVALEDIFSVLSSRMTEQVGLNERPDRPDVRIGAIPLTGQADGPLLVPYLVSTHQTATGMNQGTAGFAALLRDEIPAGDAAPRVLLVLDEHPVETVRTAAEDAAQLRSLSWTELARAAVVTDEPVQSLLMAVLDDDRKSARLEHTARTVGTLRRIAACESVVEASVSLHLLGAYLADPDAHVDPRRLRASAKWRDRLEAWSVPGQDLEGKLRRNLRASASLDRVLAARTPFGLDYGKFTLNDLLVKRAATKPLSLTVPLRTRGAPCASHLNRAAVWRSGGGTFAVLLASPADDDFVAKLKWSDGATDDLRVASGDREIAITAVGQDWRFASLELPSGSQAELAIFFGSGDWAPFEADLDIDVASSAFRCSAQPQVLALGPKGELLERQPRLSVNDVFPEDGEPMVYTVELGTQTQRIVLLLDGEEEQDPDDVGIVASPPNFAEPAGGQREDEDAHHQSARDDDISGETTYGVDLGNSKPVDSVVHAWLEDSRSDAAGNLSSAGNRSSFSVSSDGVGRILTPGLRRLASQLLRPQVDGLHLEAEIFRQPGKTAFVIARGSAGVVLEGHSYLDRLKIDSLPSDLWDSFISARVALFTALRPFGSVHAIATGVAVAEAHAYVAAYDRLLDAMRQAERFQAEFERLVLCDAVSDPETGELYLAPANPVTVQYLLSLMEQVETWLPRASELLREDIAALTPRHLMPTFSLQNTWYETGPAAPLLWRRYTLQAQVNAGDHRPGYIVRRIKHFLAVHPEYLEERQVLALAFYEPGDGAAVLEALRQLVKPLTNSTEIPAQLPRLDVTIISSADTASALERAVGGTAGGTPAVVGLDRVLRDRLTVRRAAPHEGVPEFAHLSFVFRSPLERIQTAVDMGSRARTVFVAGLATSPGRYTQAGRNETTFSWGVFSGREPDGTLHALIHKTLELVGGMPREPLAQDRTRMPSMRISGEMENIYESSAWVVHLDKLLGLEAFDPGAVASRVRYLIDYEDRADATQPGLDAITATTRIAPYRLALQQALTRFGKPSNNALDRFLKLFNGVSSKWALGLVGAEPDQLHERIGLAIATASVQDLDHGMEPVNAIGFVVPLEEMLDALPELLRRQLQSIRNLVLYLQVPLREKYVKLRGRLLAVKYEPSTSSVAASAARNSLTEAHDWLLKTFDDADGPSRQFRARDLAELVRGAITRATAFGLLPGTVDRTSLEAALDAIARADYSLTLTFQSDGETLHGDYVSIEEDSEVAVHRQVLVGEGLRLGHLRLGRAALKALASGKRLARPQSLPVVTFAEQHGGSAATQVAPAPVKQQEQRELPNQDGTAMPSPVPDIPPAEVSDMAGRLDRAFAKYGLSVEPFEPGNAQTGHSVVRFRTRTLGKLSISEVERRARDISREIAVSGDVQIADEPGFVTVDVPRAERDTLDLASVLPVLDEQDGRPGALQFAVGMAPSGEVRVSDLSRLPHLLVAGATGSGKSVFLRGLLVEMLRKRTPDQLQLMIIDPKRLDFAPFARATHVRGGIISDPNDALVVLRSTLERELDQRQPILEEAGVSSAAEFYESGGTLEELPQLVIVVDEFADLVLAGNNRKSFSELIQRYAQLTRAYGIYLVLATQRPSVDVITGSIKANLSARIAFSLPSRHDSMTILDRPGAEDLLGSGDLLFYHNGRVERLQAPLVSLGDVRRELL